jgi:hypothetical protein
VSIRISPQPPYYCQRQGERSARLLSAAVAQAVVLSVWQRLQAFGIFNVSVSVGQTKRKVWLGRSLIDLLGTIQALEACGVDLYLDQQSIDTTTPAGRLMFQITGAFAEFERRMIRQRVRAGLMRAVERVSGSGGEDRCCAGKANPEPGHAGGRQGYRSSVLVRVQRIAREMVKVSRPFDGISVAA